MKMFESERKKFLSMLAAFFVVLFAMFANGCGGGGSSGDGGIVPPPPTVEAPGVPTNFAVVATPDALLSATLTWSVPTTGGAVDTYEIYRSTTADNILDPANHIGSIPAVEGQIDYEFIDNVGLEYDVTTYWIVVAKNASGETATLPADCTLIEPPGVPNNFVVAGTKGGQDLSATLTWNVPTSGGEVVSYEIYRSTTAGTVFNPDNHLISIPAVEGQVSYVYIDNAGLIKDVPTYWVVTAKNAGAETPTPEFMFTFTNGEVESYGNNFAAAMIFADGYGITGLKLDSNKSWVKESVDPYNEIDFNTGLRPAFEQSLTDFPYWNVSTTFVKDGVTYYKQQTASTWQGEWKDGNDTEQHVTATWGDNLISQTLTGDSVIRIEMVLSKDLNASQEDNMTSYNMVSLYGSKYNEIYGTDRTEYNNTKAFVFATNAHLTIQKVAPTSEAPLYDQPLFSCDGGPGCFSSEVNVAGNFTYGFVWDLANANLNQEDKTGTWRITFSLDDTSVPTGTPNNTFIDAVTVPIEGDPSTFPVLDSNTSVHIDIIIH